MHLTGVEFVYFGATFGRPSADKLPWSPEDPMADMYAAAGESRHMIAESHRHAGHADIVRELIDGAAGLQEDRVSMPPEGREWWRDYRDRVERAAREAAARG